MMKTLTFLLAGCCLASSVSAQTSPAYNAADIVRKYLVHSPVPISAKNTALLSRVATEVDFNDYGNGNELTDSTRFIYSGQRHSTVDYYGTGYLSIYGLDDGPTVNFQYILPNPSNMDSIQYAHVSFDSLVHYTLDYTGGLLRHAHTETRIYNVDGTINTASTRTYQPSGAVTGGFRQVVLYNAGRMSKVYLMKLNGTAYDTFSIRTIAYNTSGNAILDSTSVKNSGVYQPGSRTLYTYNAAGAYLTRTLQQYNTATSSFASTQRHTNTYYASGQVRTTFLEQAQSLGMPLKPMQSDSFNYTTGVPGYTSNYGQSYSSTTGLPAGPLVMMLTNRLTAANLKDSMTFSSRQGGVTDDIFGYKFNYNAAGDIISVLAFDLQVTPHAPVYSVYYTYETYNSNVSVKPAASATDNITISPNPSTGAIILTYPDAKPGTPISVRITNASGQMVHSESFSMQGTSRQIVLGDEAAPGTYYLSVYNANGALLCAKSVLKL